MGKVIIAAGGGAGSDECTAARAELLKGYTAITRDSDDEAVEGTLELTGDAADSQVLAGKSYYNTNPKIKRTGSMVNQGAVSQTLNAGGSYTIPSGYHNGSGKVTVNSLASQTPGNASTGQILTGYNGWVNGQKVNGNIPIQGADEAADRAWATNWSTWGGGEIFLGVRNGHYLNGVNWIRYNLTNYVAGNIKKGVNIGGVIGTFEGWVPTATDLYLRGNNIINWRNLSDRYPVTFDSGQITISTQQSPGIRVDGINFTGFNSLNLEGYTDNQYGITKRLSLMQVMGSGVSDRQLGILDLTNTNAGPYVVSFNISMHQIYTNIYILAYQMSGAIYRIWLS